MDPHEARERVSMAGPELGTGRISAPPLLTAVHSPFHLLETQVSLMNKQRPRTALLVGKVLLPEVPPHLSAEAVKTVVSYNAMFPGGADTRVCIHTSAGNNTLTF